MGTEAIKLVVQKAFFEEELRKFSASIDSNNRGSLNAYQRAGFKLEAKLKNFFYRDNQEYQAYSDKLYVVYDNLDYDLEKFKKWEPICLSDIT